MLYIMTVTQTSNIIKVTSEKEKQTSYTWNHENATQMS